MAINIKNTELIKKKPVEKSKVLDFGYNYYFGLGNGSDEKVLDG